MPKKKPHPLSRLRFYVTLLASVVAIFSFFALLFLVPFVYDPAISTLSAGFPEQPNTCRLNRVRVGLKVSSCNWTSCSEGCTAPLTFCLQLFVDVSPLPYHTFEAEQPDPNALAWEQRDVPLLINIQGCGYPPEVNCTTFLRRLNAAGPQQLAAAAELRPTVPCYPSALQPELVIADFDHGHVIYSLVMASVVPSLALLASIFTLCYCHGAWCKRYCPQLPIPGEEDRMTILPPELTVSMATDIASSK